MITLRSKFIFWVCLLFILVGVLIFVPLSIILPEKISSQILKRDIRIAEYLAREVQEPLLINNKLTLKLILEDRLENLSDVIYIFIRGHDNAIISSTFKKGFPRGLLGINPTDFKQGLKYGINNPPQDSHSISKFLANGKKVYDIAIPILNGELGELHLGVSLESSKAEIAEFVKINYYLATVIFIGLGVGILIFTLLGVFLSNRIIKLKDFAMNIGRGNLNDRIDIKTKDEIGVLAMTFNDMAMNLRAKIQEINRLNIIEERNRIALDLHDGCAQNIATIIKRIELCEKFFKIDPQRALEELGALRNEARGVLDMTRQVIFDLKLPENAIFNLLDSLNNYIKSYEKQNGINVKLNVSGSFDAIPPDKSKQVFYIIGEAFTNIRKHSQAKNVELRLECNHGKLSIEIKDDGKGFDIQETELSTSSCGKWGLIGMRQRASSLGGTLVIDSVPRQGTRIFVNIPLK